jgi:NTE family protein
VVRIGLVLGGGGDVGRGFHLGVLAALEDVSGFDVRQADVIVGTSSGAPVAARLRAGLSGTNLADGACAGGRARTRSRAHRTGELRLRATAADESLPPRPFTVGWSLPASPRGVLAAAGGRGPNRLGPLVSALLPAGRTPTVSAGGPLARLFPDGWPSRRLWISAVDLDHGRRVFFGRDGDPTTDVPTAVAASCALPGWFAPVTVGDDSYVDGAVWSATNADVLAPEAMDVVVVSAPLSGSSSPLHRWQRRHLRREVQQLRAGGSQVVVVEPTRADLSSMGVNIMDRRRRAAVTHHVRAGTRERLLHGDLAPHRELLTAP